jgi:predicted transcriptional regulator
MTVTIKLEAELEQQLRQRASSTGRSTSEVVRAALQAYLATEDAGPARSAYERGADLFGRHGGPADLARNRKREAAALWAERHQARGG